MRTNRSKRQRVTRADSRHNQDPAMLDVMRDVMLDGGLPMGDKANIHSQERPMAQPSAEPRDADLPTGMTVEAFYDWCAGREGRYELLDGEVIAQAAETVRHALAKKNVDRALDAAIAAAGRDCRVFPDGVSVRIDDASNVEPDATVVCGTEVDLDAIAVPEPIIVVEVLSPGSRGTDKNRKLVAYFRVPSIQHYLIIDPERKTVIHHRRSGAQITTQIIGEGDLKLDPPGISVAVARFWVE